jgi:hypothetical protein
VDNPRPKSAPFVPFLLGLHPERAIPSQTSEGNMRTKLAWLSVALVTLSLTGCNSSPQSLIVGKWGAGQPGAKLTAEFGKDGHAQLTILGQTLRGTYQVNGGDELLWTFNGTTAKLRMKVIATELEVSGDGKTITYKRV